MVRTVHAVVKDEKDAMARGLGDSKSGVQSHITHRQKWAKWREMCAVFKCMNPKLSNQTTLDLMTFGLKLCPSKDAVFEVLQVLLKKHIVKLGRDKRNAAKKATIAQELKNIEAEETTMKEQLEVQQKAYEEVLEEKKRVEEEVSSVGGTRLQRQARVENAVSEVTERVKEVEEELKEATEHEKAIQKKKEDLEQQQEAIERPPVEIPPQKKKAKRNDTTILLEKMTPRQKVEEMGDSWKPPMRKEGRTVAYADAGAHWVTSSTHKLELLASLAHHLNSESLLDQPFTFLAVMEYIGADQCNQELDFNARVFIYIVALVLHEQA